jgi:hypothetical protein
MEHVGLVEKLLREIASARQGIVLSYVRLWRGEPLGGDLSDDAGRGDGPVDLPDDAGGDGGPDDDQPPPQSPPPPPREG